MLARLAVLWALSAWSAAPASAASPCILDPGHGGKDLGAVSKFRHEKDFTLAIARKIKQRLERLVAAPVLMTREDDSFVALDERIGKSLEWNASAFVSLHLNDVRYKKISGITVYSFGKETFKAEKRRIKVPPLPPPPKNIARDSAKLARSITRALRANGLPVEAPVKAEFYVLKNPRAPSVLVELGYLSNPQEAARLQEPHYQDQLAQALAEGIALYLKGL